MKPRKDLRNACEIIKTIGYVITNDFVRKKIILTISFIQTIFQHFKEA